MTHRLLEGVLRTTIAASFIVFISVGLLCLPLGRQVAASVVPITLAEEVGKTARTPTSSGASVVLLLQVASLSGVSICHTLLVRGVRRGALLAALEVLLVTAIEEWALASGRGFGDYSFGPSLGPRLGRMPLAVPLLWLCALTLSSGIVRAALPPPPPLPPPRHRSPRGRPGFAWARAPAVLLRALTVAFVMAGWDLANEPIYSGPGGHRIWQLNAPPLPPGQGLGSIPAVGALAVGEAAAAAASVDSSASCDAELGPGDWTWHDRSAPGLVGAPLANTVGWVCLGLALALVEVRGAAFLLLGASRQGSKAVFSGSF